MTVRVLRTTGQVVNRMSLNLGPSDVFPMIRLGDDFLKNSTMDVLFSSHSIRQYLVPSSITGDGKLHHMGTTVFARFPHCKVTIFPFPCSILCKQVLRAMYFYKQIDNFI